MSLFQTWSERWFGLWRPATFVGETNVPLLSEIVDPSWRIDDRDAVVAYLRGCRIGQSGGRPPVPCSLCGEEPLDPTEWRDDGEWSWPTRLAHMMVRHAVRLPDRMLEHV